MNAARVAVSLEGESLLLEISDAGTGFDPRSVDTHVSLGVRGMRERAELLGGTLTVTSTPGRGATVAARLPVSREDP